MREVCAGPFLKKTYKSKRLLCAGALLHYEKYNFCYQKLKNDYAQYEFKIVMASTPNKPTKILMTPRAFQGFASAFLQLRRRKLYPSFRALVFQALQHGDLAPQYARSMREVCAEYARQVKISF